MDNQFSIKKEIEGNKAVITVKGWLDVKTSPELGKIIEGLEDNITELLLEFKDLEYISSAGIRQIVAAHKKMASKGRVVLANVSPTVMDVLQMTGLDKRLNII